MWGHLISFQMVMRVGGVLGPLLLGAVATVAGFELAFAGASLLALAGAGSVAKGVFESYPGPTVTEPPAIAAVSND